MTEATHAARSPWVMLRDFFALSGGELVAKVAGFIAFAWLARTLSPEVYGRVEVAIQFSMMFSLVVDFGFGPIGARELAADPGRARPLAAAIPTLRLVLATAAYGFVYLASGFFDFDDETRTLVRWTALSLFAGPWVLNWLFQGLGRMLWVAVAQLLRMGVFAVLVLLFVGVDADVSRVAWFEIAAAFAMGGWFIAAQLRTIGGLSLGAPLAELRRLFFEALPVGLSRTLWAVYQYVPTLLVTQLIGGADVAWFAAAHRLATSLGSFVNLYHFNLYPRLVEAIHSGRAEVEALARTSYRLTAWVGVLGGLAGTLLAVPLCQLVFGERFERSGTTFAIAIWSLPISLLGSHARFVLIAGGEQRAELAANAAGAVVVLLGGIVAIGALGLEGGAVALVVGALATWATAHVLASRRVANLPVVAPLWRPLLATVVAVSIAGILFDRGWALGISAVVAYIAVAPLVDRKLVRDALALRAGRAE
jgi:O-antigen/teichoic acid export membrane protein